MRGTRDNGKVTATRTPEQLALMRKSGQITAQALSRTLTRARPGMTLKQLDKIAEDEILRLGGECAFKTVSDYHYATCINLNNEVVHGIPREIKIKEGDLLSIDLGTVYNGWYTDAAWSIYIGQQPPPQIEKFLNTGKLALRRAVSQAVEGKRIGDISSAIQTTIEAEGYSVVCALVGHGVGQSLHEPPEVPGYGQPGKGLLLQANNTLAVEVIYTAGGPDVRVDKDRWTVYTADGSLGGYFEVTVVVGHKQAEVLTDLEQWREVELLDQRSEGKRLGR